MTNWKQHCLLRKIMKNKLGIVITNVEKNSKTIYKFNLLDIKRR